MKYKKYQTYFKHEGERKWTLGIIVHARKIKEAFELAEGQYGEKSKAEIFEEKNEGKRTFKSNQSKT